MPKNPAAVAYEKFTDELLDGEEMEVCAVG